MSGIFQWTDSLSVGHQAMDQQHQLLFALANKLRTMPANREAISDVLIDLIGYIELHFSEEEALMAEVGYRDIEPHKKLHLEFANRLNSFALRLDSEPPALLLRELQTFVTSWLYQHIQGIDRHYSMYI